MNALSDLVGVKCPNTRHTHTPTHTADVLIGMLDATLHASWGSVILNYAISHLWAHQTQRDAMCHGIFTDSSCLHLSVFYYLALCLPDFWILLVCVILSGPGLCWLCLHLHIHSRNSSQGTNPAVFNIVHNWFIFTVCILEYTDERTAK